MKIVIKSFFLFILLLLSFQFYGYSKESRREIEIRKVPKERIQKYLNDSSFDYAFEYKEPVTLWDKVVFFFRKYFLNPLRQHTPESVWQIFKFGLMIFAASVVIYFLLKSNKTGFFAKKNPTNSTIPFYTGENIHEVNFDELVENAVSKGQYRVAVRYLYLSALKSLSDKELITWKAEKTNRDYNKELRSSAIAPQFKEITWLFDYSWYGQSGISEETYQIINSSFSNFNKALNLRK